MPLVRCQTENAGLLCEAATAKRDEKILLQIQDKDCVPLEARYHKKCYKNYTSFLYRKQESAGEEYSLLNAATFEKFCKDVIEPLIEHNKIEYMAHLYVRFLQIVEEVEGADASNFRRFRLKERLKNSYPQLMFHTPRIRNHSEIVYAENLSAEDLIDEHMQAINFIMMLKMMVMVMMSLKMRLNARRKMFQVVYHHLMRFNSYIMPQL